MCHSKSYNCNSAIPSRGFVYYTLSQYTNRIKQKTFIRWIRVFCLHVLGRVSIIRISGKCGMVINMDTKVTYIVFFLMSNINSIDAFASVIGVFDGANIGKVQKALNDYLHEKDVEIKDNGYFFSDANGDTCKLTLKRYLKDTIVD